MKLARSSPKASRSLLVVSTAILAGGLVLLLWIRSTSRTVRYSIVYQSTARMEHAERVRIWMLQSVRGTVQFSWMNTTDPKSRFSRDGIQFNRQAVRDVGTITQQDVGRFLPGMLWRSASAQHAFNTIAVSHWYVIAVVALLCGWSTWRLTRLRTATEGSCARCGYDLRASKERCPECGTPIPVEMSVASPSSTLMNGKELPQ